VKTWKNLKKKQKKKLEKRTPKKFLNSKNDHQFFRSFQKIVRILRISIFNSYKKPREGTFKNLTLKKLLKTPKNHLENPI
jgi:hypothetical protein